MKFPCFTFNLFSKSANRYLIAIIWILFETIPILFRPLTAQTNQWTSCHATGCKGSNLVTHGGFEDHVPNSGALSPDISTDFGMIICPPDDPSDLWGHVLIARNPLICYEFWNITDHTFGDGTGNMMIIDFPDSNPLGGLSFMDIWSKNITVDSGKTYCFGAWFKNLNSDTTLSKPNFRYLVNDTLIGISQELPYDPTNKWTFYGFEYVSKAAGPITITIQNGKWGGQGNDLAMDDVEFREVANGSLPPVAVNDDGGIMGFNSFKTFYVTGNDTLNTNTPVNNTHVSIYSVTPDNLGTAAVDISGNITFASNGQLGTVKIVYEYCQPTGCCDQAVLSFLVDTILSSNWIQNFHGEESYGGIHLSWNSSGEPQKVLYKLSRSFDQKNYIEVASIDQVSTAGEKTYKYLDNGLFFNGAGNVYYRLSATDKAGNHYQTLQTQVKIGEKELNSLHFRIFPSPANSHILNIFFTDPVVRETEIVLSNISGQVFSKNSLIGKNTTSLNIRDLAAGVYFISASDGRLKEVIKFQVYK
jgi:hypothetical protein